MSRPTPAVRTRLLLLRAADALEDIPARVIVLGTGIVANLGLHLLLADPNVAWASAPLVLLAGLVGGVRVAVAIAVAVGIGHTAIDIVLGTAFAGLLGYLLRIGVLMGVALVGSAGALIEAQRTKAVRRAISEDPTTGLLSVRTFYDELEGLQAQGVGFTILLVDIRGMRRLNETYGHPTGTEAMRALAHVLRRAAGPTALASRLGSDEVAVALVGGNRQQCHQLADDMIERLHEEKVTLPDGARFEIHVAYGIARYPEDGTDVVRVLRAADEAKQRAKAVARPQTSDGLPADPIP